MLSRRFGLMGTENAFRLADDIRRCEERGLRVIRFNLGAPDFTSAAHLNEIAAASLLGGNAGYCDAGGIVEFREAIARHVERTRGVPVDPDRVVVTPGAKPPIGYSFQTWVDPGDEVVYPSPGFPIYESWATYSEARLVPLHLAEDKGFRLTSADLARAVGPRTKLIILCSPSNPTGGVLDQAELAELAAVIRDRCPPETRVYSDEIYEHILFDGREHASIASQPGMAGRTIIASGLSKGFAMPGWRLGWAVPPTVREAEAFRQLNINTVSCVPPFLQHGGIAAYEDPRTPPVVARMAAAFERRRDWTVPALNALEGVRCQMPGGAFYVFPNVEGVCERLGAVELAAELKLRAGPSRLLQMFLLYRYGVATMDRASFGSVGSAGQHFLRLSIANSMEDLREGVDRMATAFDDADGLARFVREEAWLRENAT